MKAWYTLSIFLLCAVCTLAQDKALKRSKIITCKKVYMYYHGNTGGDIAKTITDSLLIPIVSDKYPALKHALSEEHLVNDEPIINNVKRYESDGTGITSLDYEVTFENKDIISIHLFYESMGAHPSEYQEWYTYNIHTGKLYPISNEINQTGLKWIFQTYKANYHKAINQDQRWRTKEDEDYKKDEAEEKLYYDDLRHSIDSLSFKEMFANWAFTAKGVLFITEYVLPHARQSYEPGRAWEVPYAKLRPYKKPTAIVVK